jgi:hypothetical protein
LPKKMNGGWKRAAFDGVTCSVAAALTAALRRPVWI